MTCLFSPPQTHAGAASSHSSAHTGAGHRGLASATTDERGRTGGGRLRPHAPAACARPAPPGSCTIDVRIDDLSTPALLLDLDVLERNVERMARRARRLRVRLRPHLKTHKCPEVARLQADAGASGFTVSTLHEARVFADAGFDDFTWAFPVGPGRVDEVVELADRVRLGVVVDGREATELLASAGAGLPVWIAVDCGGGREGLAPEDPELIAVARAIDASADLRLDGLLTHSGQAYRAEGPDGLARAAEEERESMVRAAGRLRDAGVPVPTVSVGSTPAMSRARDLEGVDEARPGNYVFHDHTQVRLGACGVEDVALTVLATVVSSRPETGHAVVDAGALALSVDRGPEHLLPQPSMGEVYRDHGAGELHDDLRLTSLSQEHGVLSRPLPWGERVRILPNHSCLAAACFDRYHVVRGDEVVDRWRVRRGRS